MKALLLLPLLMLASCVSGLNPKDYSFALTDKVVSSSIEKDDDNDSKYTTCNRSGEIAWELSVKPQNFTGIVKAQGSAKWGDYNWDKKITYYFEVADGKMAPITFSAYGSWSDRERLKKICAISDAKQFNFDIDNDSVIMLPGVTPFYADSSSNAE